MLLTILQQLKVLLSSSDTQLEPGLSCSHAIYSVRKVVDHYINGGSTVIMCTIDLSKAFDKMNHSALFVKHIKRKISIYHLRIIEYWFSHSFTCFRLGLQYSQSYKQLTGARQGGVLSPCLFAIFIDEIAKHVSVTGKR